MILNGDLASAIFAFLTILGFRLDLFEAFFYRTRVSRERRRHPDECSTGTLIRTLELFCSVGCVTLFRVEPSLRLGM
jgi:hypothetical protein